LNKGTRKEIRMAGFGGQGIVLSTVIMGRAVAMYMGMHAAVMESYGPESRGGACTGGVVIDEEPVDYPYVVSPDILMVMSQEAYTKFGGTVEAGGILIVDEDLVELSGGDRAKVFRVPATRMAESLGKKIVANIIMLGAFTGLSDIITFEAMKKAILAMVPPHTRDLNQKAVLQGYEYGLKLKTGVEVAP
jgi:2-oxoglutarate ferredoxin oxidoreductase subunit gamma